MNDFSVSSPSSTMHENPEEEKALDEMLCQRITAAMARNGLPDVQCQLDAKGPRLTGVVESDEERAIAFAIARTTAGTVNLSNGIEVRRKSD